MADYLFLLESRLSPDQQTTIRLLRQIAKQAGMNLYLTGGPMRDLLTGSPVRYLDFTVEGAPAALEPGLGAVGATWINANRDEQVVRFRLRGQRGRIRAARAPAAAGAAPASGFRPGTIDEDLRTRGLTLNSIGLSLAEASHGLLRDPTNGQSDIEARLIRMNHTYVFYEDPVYLLRAVRLQTRLQFGIEERTQARIESARENKYLEKASPVSLGQEIEAIAYEPEPAQVLRALDQAGLLEEAFGEGVRAAKMNLTALAQLGKEIEEWEQLGLTPDSGLIALPLMLGKLGTAEQNRLSRMLQNASLAEQWRKLPAAAQALEKKLLTHASEPLEQTAEMLEKAQPEAVAYVGLAPSDTKAQKKLRDFQAKAQPLRQRLPVRFLPQVGIAPHSAEAQKVLGALYKRLLRGELTQEPELLAALHEITGPPPPLVPVKSAGPRRGMGGRPPAPAPPAVPMAKPAPAAPAIGVKPGTAAPAAPAAKPASAPTKPAEAAAPAAKEPAAKKAEAAQPAAVQRTASNGARGKEATAPRAATKPAAQKAAPAKPPEKSATAASAKPAAKAAKPAPKRAAKAKTPTKAKAPAKKSKPPSRAQSRSGR